MWRAGLVSLVISLQAAGISINYGKLYSTTLSKQSQWRKVPPEEDQEALTYECFPMVVPKGRRQY